MLTDDGVEAMEKVLGVDNLFEAKNIQLVHHVNQALRAHTLYKRNVNYLVEEGKVVIVDEHTGRKMPGRRWSDVLHQAIEAKEGVTVEEENQTIATVTFQNYFRMYKKLAGMTGTADTEAPEFNEIYKLDVSVIPTNKLITRKDPSDLVYKNEAGKFRAIASDIEDCHKHGQPVLVGTVSVEKSEVVANILRQKGLPFNVLNAKQHQREASIVAQAGRKGAITIATNMAGRGTDILLGGNHEAMAKDALAEEKAKLIEAEDAKQPGELGTDRGSSQPDFDEDKRYTELLARIQGAARGRAPGGARRGRPQDRRHRAPRGRDGSTTSCAAAPVDRRSRLVAVLPVAAGRSAADLWPRQDDRAHGAPGPRRGRLPIDLGMVTKSIENAQKKVEGQNFDRRKNVLEYDDVMNQQRKTIYALRRQVLDGRYHREPTEDEEKAGIVPEPVTESGNWTPGVADARRQDARVSAMIEELAKNKVNERDNAVARGEDHPRYAARLAHLARRDLAPVRHAARRREDLGWSARRARRAGGQRRGRVADPAARTALRPRARAHGCRDRRGARSRQDRRRMGLGPARGRAQGAVQPRLRDRTGHA